MRLNRRFDHRHHASGVLSSHLDPDPTLPPAANDEVHNTQQTPRTDKHSSRLDALLRRGRTLSGVPATLRSFRFQISAHLEELVIACVPLP